jgi:hypothetical protein
MIFVSTILAGSFLACGGNGDGQGGNNGGDGVKISPASGPPGTEITVSPGCDEPLSDGSFLMILTWKGTAETGEAIFVPSIGDRATSGNSDVPEVIPGTYRVNVSCGDQDLGDVTYEVTE